MRQQLLKQPMHIHKQTSQSENKRCNGDEKKKRSGKVRVKSHCFFLLFHSPLSFRRASHSSLLVQSQDHAILQLKVQKDRLHKYSKQIAAVIVREVELAKQMLREDKKKKSVAWRKGRVIGAGRRLERCSSIFSFSSLFTFLFCLFYLFFFLFFSFFS